MNKTRRARFSSRPTSPAVPSMDDVFAMATILQQIVSPLHEYFSSSKHPWFANNTADI
jgi:hypothetical protein